MANGCLKCIYVKHISATIEILQSTECILPIQKTTNIKPNRHRIKHVRIRNF